LTKILRPIPHKIGHFKDVPQANLLAWYGKTKPNTTKARIHQSKQKNYNTTTTTTTILRPFVRDYPGEPVPKETLTHPPS